MMINFLASQGRRPRAVGGTDFISMLETQPALSHEDPAQFEREYKQRLFEWAADQIQAEFHETTWRAFWDTWVIGKKPRDVAAEIGMNVGAVYMARSRVVARLRELIESVEIDALDD